MLVPELYSSCEVSNMVIQDQQHLADSLNALLKGRPERILTVYTKTAADRPGAPPSGFAKVCAWSLVRAKVYAFTLLLE